jgi:hypothetical protein
MRALKLKFPGVEFNPEAVLEQAELFVSPEKPFLNEFEATMEKWVDRSLGSNERMVVFVDDLDRCMPDIALQVLEALKLYLAIERLVFVVGVDKGVISELVTRYYTNQGLDVEKSRAYLDKMFQVEVHLSSTDQQIEDFLEAQLEELPLWSKLDDKHQSLFERLVLSIAKRNPREVKRLLNSALIEGSAGLIDVRSDLSGEVERSLKLSQGLQQYFLRRALETKEVGSHFLDQRRGQEFLYDWSETARGSRGETRRFTVPASAYTLGEGETFHDERSGSPSADDERLSNVPLEFHDLIRKWRVRPRPGELFGLIDNKDVWDLMQVPYPQPSERTLVLSSALQESILR